MDSGLGMAEARGERPRRAKRAREMKVFLANAIAIG